MKNKDYKKCKDKKMTQLERFKRNLDRALSRAHERGKEYVEWKLNNMYRKYVEANYRFDIAGTEIDLYSFPTTFNINFSKSKTLCNLYYMRGKGERYITVYLDSLQEAECKAIGLILCHRKYRIYGPKRNRK